MILNRDMWKILKLVRCVSGNYLSRECGGGRGMKWVMGEGKWKTGERKGKVDRQRDRLKENDREADSETDKDTLRRGTESRDKARSKDDKQRFEMSQLGAWRDSGRLWHFILWFLAVRAKKKKSSKKKFHRTFIVLYLKYSYHVDAYSLLLPRWGTCPALSGCLAFPWCGCIV